MSICKHGQFSWVSPPCEKCEQEATLSSYPGHRPRPMIDVNVEGLPEAWLPSMRLKGGRPSIAPGEWPEDVYAGRYSTYMDHKLLWFNAGPDIPQIDDVLAKYFPFPFIGDVR